MGERVRLKSWTVSKALASLLFCLLAFAYGKFPCFSPRHMCSDLEFCLRPFSDTERYLLILNFCVIVNVFFVENSVFNEEKLRPFTNGGCHNSIVSMFVKGCPGGVCECVCVCVCSSVN